MKEEWENKELRRKKKQIYRNLTNNNEKKYKRMA